MHFKYIEFNLIVQFFVWWSLKNKAWTEKRYRKCFNRDSKYK